MLAIPAAHSYLVLKGNCHLRFVVVKTNCGVQHACDLRKGCAQEHIVLGKAETGQAIVELQSDAYNITCPCRL